MNEKYGKGIKYMASGESQMSNDISNVYHYKIPAMNGHEAQKGVVLASNETTARKKVCDTYHLNFDYASLKEEDIKVKFISTRLFPGYSDVFPMHD